VFRIVLLTLAVLIAASLAFFVQWSGASQPLSIEVAQLPKGTKVLDIGEIGPRTSSLQYNLVVVSRTSETVNLKVRLAPGSSEGLAAHLVLQKPIRPAGRETIRLVLSPPPSVGAERAGPGSFRGQLGPFRATIVLYADELPGWTHEYEFKGTVVDTPLSGNYLELRPAGIDLGAMRLGETRKFEFELVNIGDAEINVSEFRIPNRAAIKLFSADDSATIKPGETLKVEGEARIVGQDKRFEARIVVVSDAVNAKLRWLVVQATIVGDYELLPERLPARSAYAQQAPRYTLKVKAAKGIAPFVVSTPLKGLDPLFELSTPLSTEPAAEQTIELRLRPDAPTGVGVMQGAIGITLEPSGVTLNWPYQLRVLPPLFPQPQRIDFGTVSRSGLNKALEKSVQIVALPGRPFRLTGVRTERRYFQTRIAEHGAGMPWEIIVALPALADKGVYRDKILIETSDPDVPKIVVPVRANVR